MQESAGFVDRFARVVATITGLSPYDLGGTALVESYLDELTQSAGRDRVDALVESAATWVFLEGQPPATASMVRRQLVPGADAAGLTDAARHLLPVTELASALGRDVATAAAACVATLGLSTETVHRLWLAPRVVAALRSAHGPSGATEQLTAARDELDAIQDRIVQAHVASDLRRPTPELDPAAMAVTLPAGLGDEIAAQAGRLLDWVGAIMTAQGATEVPTDLRAVDPGFLAYADRTLPGSSDAAPADPSQVADSLDTFSGIGAVLTGLTDAEILGTGQRAAYLDQMLRSVGLLVGLGFVAASTQVMAAEPAEREGLAKTLLLDTPKYGPVARAVIKMWYLGQWQLEPADWYAQYAPGLENGAGPITVSASAYKSGAAWGIAGGHVQGANQPGFASWTLPPGTDVVV